MAPTDPATEGTVRELVAEALSQANVSPRVRRRGRPSRAYSEPLIAESEVNWPKDGRLFIDERGAMQALGVKRTTIWKLQRTGVITPRYVGRSKHFLRSDLVAAAAAMPTRRT